MHTWVRIGFVALMGVAFCAAVGSCKRKRPPAAQVGEEESAKAGQPEVAAEAKRAKPPAMSPAATGASARFIKKAAAEAEEPDKAAKPAHGFPVPVGLSSIHADPNASQYRSVHSIKNLEKFYRREVGRDGELKKRGHGFEVRMKGQNGFLLVTRPPAQDWTMISIVGHMETRVAPRARDSESYRPHLSDDTGAPLVIPPAQAPAPKTTYTPPTR